MRLETTWGQAATAVGGRLAKGSPDAAFDALSIDSRRLAAGEAFWALKGERFDGHDFLPQARSAAGWVAQAGRWPREGAPAQVLEVADPLAALQALAAWHRSRFSLDVAAVCGSNGKTTSKEMLRAILEAAGPACATKGNLNNHIGVPLSLLELRPEHRRAVFELGSSAPGEVRALARLARPRVGLITNIAAEHMEFYKTMEAVFEGETELVGELPPDGPVVVPLQDEWLARLLPRLGPRARTFGFEEAAEVRAVPSGDGVELRLDGMAWVSAPLKGRLLQLNAAGAALSAHALGVPREAVEAGLRAFKPAALRLETRRHASGTDLFLDAYNANPASMRASLKTFCELFAGRALGAVLGDMLELGESEGPEHRALGAELAASSVERFILVGPAMRQAYDAARAAGLAAERVRHVEAVGPDLAEALRPCLGPGKALLFKGSRGVGLEKVLDLL